MNVYDYAFNILNSKTLEDKLFSCDKVSYDKSKAYKSLSFIRPARAKAIEFQEKQIKFPKRNKLKTAEGKAIALNFFANHELLAIEMMAQAILQFNDVDQKTLRTLVSTIKDEQRHFLLYSKRMNELGYNFGDFPLNAFFWHQMKKMTSFAQFYALVALTFEQANLDFAYYYRKLFLEIGDEQTANILKVIHDDEVRHVARGQKYLSSHLENSDQLWKYYIELLPDNITPSRAKGMVFNKNARYEAGLKENFISSLENYQDSFRVTQRKTWKKS